MPAYNEEGSVARVIDEIRAFDPGFEVVVVDDGSGDCTIEVAEEMGARVLTPPYNLGIGGSVQTAFRYALENDFELAVRLDGDGLYDAAHLPALVAPVLDGEADVAVGSRYLADGGYKQSAHRNIGNRILAGAASFRRATARPIHRRGSRRSTGTRSSSSQGTTRTSFPRWRPRCSPRSTGCAGSRFPPNARAAGGHVLPRRPQVHVLLAKVLVALFVAMFRRNVVPGETR